MGFAKGSLSVVLPRGCLTCNPRHDFIPALIKKSFLKPTIRIKRVVRVGKNSNNQSTSESIRQVWDLGFSFTSVSGIAALLVDDFSDVSPGYVILVLIFTISIGWYLAVLESGMDSSHWSRGYPSQRSYLGLVFQRSEILCKLLNYQRHAKEHQSNGRKSLVTQSWASEFCRWLCPETTRFRQPL